MKIRRLFTLICAFQISLNSSIAQNNTTEHSITEKRPVNLFNKIVMSGGDVTVKYSSSPMIELSGSKTCLELIETRTSGNTLIIKDRGAHQHRQDCKVKINIGIPMVTAIEQNGGGDISVASGFVAQSEFHCKIDGGGKIDASNLNVRSCYASISGGGAILLNASQLLDGKISGGGTIEYRGDPKVISDVSGGGRISRR